MTVELDVSCNTPRLGLKGPRGGEWLAAHGLVLPTTANTWNEFDAVLVARLGSTEFFLEATTGGGIVERLAAALATGPDGVYPVLREDWGCVLRGAAVHEVLTQVCNVNFARVTFESRSLVMTSMAGVSVLVLPIDEHIESGYRIWCDPTFGPYLSETLSAVVIECGGNYKGATA